MTIFSIAVTIVVGGKMAQLPLITTDNLNGKVPKILMFVERILYIKDQQSSLMANIFKL